MEVVIKTLWETSKQIDSALRRLDYLTRGINGEITDPLEKAGLEHEPESFIDELPNLNDAFEGSYVLLRDNWKTIENNRVWLSEILAFRDKFQTFKDAVLAFDDLRIEKYERYREVVWNNELAMSLVVLAARAEEHLAAAFKYAEDTLPALKPKSSVSPLQGLCEEMKAYFSGLTDKDLEDAILHGLNIGRKGDWIGKVTQGTYFGKHFGVTASRMNGIFNFYGEQNQPTKVHYTRYPADNIRPDDHIAVILSKYPHREK